jgi:hypothetical protein
MDWIISITIGVLATLTVEGIFKEVKREAIISERLRHI